jgi:hypothetical protein
VFQVGILLFSGKYVRVSCGKSVFHVDRSVFQVARSVFQVARSVFQAGRIVFPLD